MDIIEHIKNNETGEVRHYHFSMDEGRLQSFSLWEDGDCSCDCNRALHFGYAVGDKPDEIDAKCGNGGFSVNVEFMGKIHYREFE